MITATRAADELATGDFPVWLTVLASLSLGVAVLLAVLVQVQVLRRPERMAVMNVVWPLTMLFGSVLWYRLYRRSRESDDTPLRRSIAVGASHCGAGCTLGDLIGEFGLAALPGLAGLVGLGSLYEDRIFAGWIIDFVLAYLIGVGFQYFAIAPMRQLSLGHGLWAAIKADTLSITSWQVGMYGTMAIGQFLILPALFGGRAAVLSPEFWFVMQFAMLGGFATAYPVNAYLIRAGIKERM